MRVIMFFMPSCKEVSCLVSESMDRDLPFRQRFSMRLHLLMCSLCSRFRRQIMFLREAAHSFGEAHDGDELFSKVELSADARARIKQAVHANGD
jgi:hypothetical protein